VIACPSHEASQIAPITRSSEFEYTRVRQPPMRAQAGASASAWRPNFWSASDSVPASSGFLDSGEPRWMSQTVAKMNSENCRYSDCQFSSTSTPKSDERT